MSAGQSFCSVGVASSGRLVQLLVLDMAADGGLVDVIGGIDPAGFDHTPGGTGGGPRRLDTVFGIAERHGLPIDIHDTGETGTATLTDIAERTRAAWLTRPGHGQPRLRRS
ncbi:hypothetical protein ACVH9Z_06675 [Rhodococcus opacus]|uniref:hypothetical protein n=1 Tax=Rhodococcus opacus TaxID=37919 RepID=UPI001FEE3854|nr:hypothetical protein [Rhodococcus opacus]